MAEKMALEAGSVTRPRGRVRGTLPGVRGENGQALVEFAIVLPLILLIVLGIVDFGLAYNYKNDQTSLANQALRYAEVNACPSCGGSTPTLETYVKSTADSNELMNGNSPPGSWGIQPNGVEISFCLPDPSEDQTGVQGEPLEAKATTSYNWLPFLGIGVSTPIVARAIGRIEQTRTQVNGSYVYGPNGPTLPYC
jgi:hypothetical protein